MEKDKSILGVIHDVTGISRSGLHSYLSGASVPGLENAEKIAEACGYTLSEFIKDNGKPIPVKEHGLLECLRRLTEAASKGGQLTKNPGETPADKELDADELEKRLRGGMKKDLPLTEKPQSKKLKD